jgi:hypothetical protein
LPDETGNVDRGRVMLEGRLISGERRPVFGGSKPCVLLLRGGSVERGHRRTVLSHDDGRDPLADRALDGRMSKERVVGVRVEVEEARTHMTAVRIDVESALRAGQISHERNPTILDRDVRATRRTA